MRPGHGRTGRRAAWPHIDGPVCLDLFYLPTKLRGGGVGSAALRTAEVEAVRRGCRAATLVTVNFQAPEFYARHGWEEFGRIESAPGVERIFMRKSLNG